MWKWKMSLSYKKEKAAFIIFINFKKERCENERCHFIFFLKNEKAAFIFFIN